MHTTVNVHKFLNTILYIYILFTIACNNIHILNYLSSLEHAITGGHTEEGTPAGVNIPAAVIGSISGLVVFALVAVIIIQARKLKYIWFVFDLALNNNILLNKTLAF